MSEPFWTPLGGQPVDYEGAWAAGTQYAPGDVVTYNGINYLAVNPSLGVTPPAAVQSGVELDFAEVTAVVTVATSSTVIVSGNPITCDGLPVIVSVNVPDAIASQAGMSWSARLFVDGVDAGIIGNVEIGSTGQMSGMSCWARYVPTPGVHTFSIRGTTSAGTAALQAGAGGVGAFRPIQMRVARA